MVIGSAKTPDGKSWILIGLSKKNVDGLKERDIMLKKDTHPPMPEDVLIGIVYAETEAELADRLRAIGLIGPETRVDGEPDGKERP